MESLTHCPLNGQTPWLENISDPLLFLCLFPLFRTLLISCLNSILFSLNFYNLPFFFLSLSFNKSHFSYVTIVFIVKLCLYFTFMIPLLYFPLPKSLLSFFLCLFSFRPSLSPPAFSLILSPQGAAEFTILFSCHSVHSSVADLFFTSLSMKSVCAFEKDDLCIGSALEEGVIIPKKMQNVSGWVDFSKKNYFNREDQQMQKLNSNIHKIWSLCVSNTLPLYPAGVLQDQVEAHSFKRSLAILFLFFISQKVLSNFFSTIY